ncbi:hypothetical protein M8J71_10910 [Pseudarthrobacter sp. R1]|uniref:hypothetical protein n=1 Tax=Pseudarthrobacter sp. R1 TaxID=2944934 RepID=UPI00210C68CF|nr:hypothetical protein [Pseudarthrobacter sp. R1]MCQ6270993.1 hypothetical protein [Pseudarthrobacter sp. R1]
MGREPEPSVVDDFWSCGVGFGHHQLTHTRVFLARGTMRQRGARRRCEDDEGRHPWVPAFEPLVV